MLLLHQHVTHGIKCLVDCLFNVTHHSHHRNSGLPPLMCRQRWKPHGCHCVVVGVRRQTVRLKEVLGFESERRSEPVGGPEGYRKSQSEYIKFNFNCVKINCHLY